MPTIDQIAAWAKVSKSTVSLVLNDKPRVSPRTRRKVLAILKQHKYIANPFARALRNAKTRTIGVVLPDLANPSTPEVLRGIHAVLDAKDYLILLAESNDRQPGEDRQSRQIKNLFARGAEGLLIMPVRAAAPRDNWYPWKTLPLVFFNGRPGDSHHDAVLPDDQMAASLITRHLLDLGRRPILHIAAPQTFFGGGIRRQTFLQTLREAGVRDDEALAWIFETPQRTVQGGVTAMERVMRAFRPPFSVFAVNGLVALGVWRYAHEHGLRIPGDIAIAGFGSESLLDVAGVPLTFAKVSFFEVGRTAADMLLRRIGSPQDSATPQTILIPAQLVVRDSTRTGSPAGKTASAG